MAGIGNTLTTWIGTDPNPVTTTRNTGESDNDFIDRHCRALLARLNGTTAVLKNSETGISMSPLPLESAADEVTRFASALKAAN